MSNDDTTRSGTILKGCGPGPSELSAGVCVLMAGAVLSVLIHTQHATRTAHTTHRVLSPGPRHSKMPWTGRTVP